MNPGFSRFIPGASRIESCFQDGLGPYNGRVHRIFTSIARKGVWLLLAGLLALGANLTFAGAPGGGAPLFQGHQMTGAAHSGWLAQHFGPADQVSRDRPDDGASERMRCLLACMALVTQADVLFIELPPQPSSRAKPRRPTTLRGKTQTRPRPHPGPPRPALPV